MVEAESAAADRENRRRLDAFCDGETGKLTKWYFVGQTIKLPDAPMKDGFTFVGWETTVKGEKVVLQPGEEFTVTGAQSFTALWTEA